jgi:hypothetical protein
MVLVGSNPRGKHIHPRDLPFGHRRNCRDRAPRPPARPRTGATREALTRSGYSRCASRRPFSIRADADAAGGNRFVPARFVLDAGVSDPRSRVVRVRSVLGEWKHDPALGMTDALSGLLNRLPPAPHDPSLRIDAQGQGFRGHQYARASVRELRGRGPRLRSPCIRPTIGGRGERGPADLGRARAHRDQHRHVSLGRRPCPGRLRARRLRGDRLVYAYRTPASTGRAPQRGCHVQT